MLYLLYISGIASVTGLGQASLERIEASEALSVAARDAVTLLEKEVASLAERLNAFVAAQIRGQWLI